MPLEVFVVDAFTDRPFRGNPAGVCIVSSPLEESLMQEIALEMNHAETAFLSETAPGQYHLRWFTPAKEVPLCGHATLASAHVLFEQRLVPDGTVVFDTLSGELTATKQGPKIVMDFPSEFLEPEPNMTAFKQALGVPLVYVGKNRMFWLAELRDEASVRTFIPNQGAIADLGLEGIIITAKSDSGADDFVSRLFAPNVGIPEDPVTGSAHCILAPYWASKLGKTEMVGYQASKRGGYVALEFLGARVLLKGNAVTTLVAQLQVNPR